MEHYQQLTAITTAVQYTCMSIPRIRPPLLGGPSDSQATCSHAPGWQPRSSIWPPWGISLCFCCISSSLYAERAT